jgi:hypothetical protein
MMSDLANAVMSAHNNSRLMLGLLMVFVLPGCAAVDVYNMQGMEGTVVDKATGEPIEGVMIVEVWEAGGGLEGHTVDYLPLQEAVTDHSGRYELPARGSKHIDEGFLKPSTPRLIYFKPGYTFFSKRNRYHPDRRFEFNRRSDWHQKTIELEKFVGTPKQQAKELERFSNVLDNFTGRGGWCIWTGIPKTLRLIRHEDIRLEGKGVDPKVAISAPWIMEEFGKCPDFEGFIKVFNNNAQ